MFVFCVFVLCVSCDWFISIVHSFPLKIGFWGVLVGFAHEVVSCHSKLCMYVCVMIGSGPKQVICVCVLYLCVSHETQCSQMANTQCMLFGQCMWEGK